MRDVVFDLKVFHLEVFNFLHFSLELDLWEGVRLTLELNLQGLDVVVVHVRVAQGVDKLAGLQTWNEELVLNRFQGCGASLFLLNFNTTLF